MSKDGGQSEIMPMREGLGEQHHRVSDRTLTSRAADAHPVRPTLWMQWSDAGGEGGG
jgi:hypothetical protein